MPSGERAPRRRADKLQIAQAHADWSVPALWVFLGAYVVFAGMTWFFYLRRSFAARRIPSLAHASI
jgi:MFS transporter, NNP family, nitrate/nitrite transporter